jgi:hypothetical protein
MLFVLVVSCKPQVASGVEHFQGSGGTPELGRFRVCGVCGHLPPWASGSVKPLRWRSCSRCWHGTGCNSPAGGPLRRASAVTPVRVMLRDDQPHTDSIGCHQEARRVAPAGLRDLDLPRRSSHEVLQVSLLGLQHRPVAPTCWWRASNACPASGPRRRTYCDTTRSCLLNQPGPVTRKGLPRFLLPGYPRPGWQCPGS